MHNRRQPLSRSKQENRRSGEYKETNSKIGADSPTALRAVRTNDEIENTNALMKSAGACIFDLAVRFVTPAAGRRWRVLVHAFSLSPFLLFALETAKAA
jgi:hypothetical protein